MVVFKSTLYLVQQDLKLFIILTGVDAATILRGSLNALCFRQAFFPDATEICEVDLISGLVEVVFHKQLWYVLAVQLKHLPAAGSLHRLMLSYMMVKTAKPSDVYFTPGKRLKDSKPEVSVEDRLVPKHEALGLRCQNFNKSHVTSPDFI